MSLQQRTFYLPIIFATSAVQPLRPGADEQVSGNAANGAEVDRAQLRRVPAELGAGAAVDITFHSLVPRKTAPLAPSRGRQVLGTARGRGRR
jgi:hypothetical protein